VAQATGVERTVEALTEEAIVGAVESPAVERALARVLKGPVVEEAMRDAVSSAAVERALTNALDSELVDNVWRRLLASDEAQQLVERIAQAPEVRSAIAAQSVGFLDDVRREIGQGARRLDDAFERILRRVLFRRRRTEPTDRAGLVTRGLAFAVDIGILNAIFFAISALVALVASVVFPGEATSEALVFGVGVWLVAGSLYLVGFWTLAGQTPGMRFLGIRLEADGSTEIGLRIALRRLLGSVLAAIPFGLGFLPIATSDRRRGLQDRIAHTEVRYTELERAAPWVSSSPTLNSPG
jgi:uncharacterized RDD family membrane protein YckC